MYKLTNEDYKIFNDLVEVTTLIKEYYDMLSTLEQSSDKNIIEYNHCIERLKQAITLEKNIYDKFNDIDKICELLIFVSDNKDVDVFDMLSYSFLPTVIPVKQRILNNLVLKYVKEGNVILDGTVYELVSNSEMTKEELEKIYIFQSNYLNVLINDIVNLSLAIYSEKSNLKYDLIFLFSNIENQYINSKFIINRNPYLLSKGNDTSYDLSGVLDINLTGYLCSSIVSEQIKNLASFDNSYFEIKENFDKAMMQQAIIRASLVLINREIRQAIKLKFNDYYKKIKKHHLIGHELIYDSFNELNQDKKIPKFVYFKKM